jgi:hypothetical protein
LPAASEIRLRRVEEEIPRGFQIKSKKRAKSLPLEGKVAEAEQRSAKTDEVEMIEETPSAFQPQLFTIH